MSDRAGVANALSLPTALIGALIDEARAAGDAEICGFIAAADGRFWQYPIRNRAPAPARRFDMDTAEQIAAFKAMRERGQQLIAIYHSHPDAPATPSAHDVAGHSYPDITALIIAPKAEPDAAIRAWRIKQGAVVPITLLSDPH